MIRTETRLSTIWIFATLNYLYCDVVTLMDPTLLNGYLSGRVGSITISQGFLLAAGGLVEIPIAMVIVSRLLNPRASRVANLVAGTAMTVVQLASLFVRIPAPYYVFFSVFEIGATAVIVWLAWRWKTSAAGYAESPGDPTDEPLARATFTR